MCWAPVVCAAMGTRTGLGMVWGDCIRAGIALQCARRAYVTLLSRDFSCFGVFLFPVSSVAVGVSSPRQPSPVAGGLCVASLRAVRGFVLFL